MHTIPHLIMHHVHIDPYVCIYKKGGYGGYGGYSVDFKGAGGVTTSAKGGYRWLRGYASLTQRLTVLPATRTGLLT